MSESRFYTQEELDRLVEQRVSERLKEKEAKPRRSQMSTLEKVRYVKEHGADAYQQLPD